MALPLTSIAARFFALSRFARSDGPQTVELPRLQTLGRFSFRVRGLRRLNRQLRTLEGFTQRQQTLVPALVKGIKIVQREAKVRVPKRSGTLHDAIVINDDQKRNEGIGRFAVRLFVEHGEGARNDAYYGHMVEFGTGSHGIPKGGKRRIRPMTNFRTEGANARWFGTRVQHPGQEAQPFMRPAIDAKRKQAVNKFRDELRRSLRTRVRR